MLPNFVLSYLIPSCLSRSSAVMKRLLRDVSSPEPAYHEAQFAIAVTLSLTNESMKPPKMERDRFKVLWDLWARINEYNDREFMEDFPSHEVNEIYAYWGKGMKQIASLETGMDFYSLIDKINFTRLKNTLKLWWIDTRALDDGFIWWRIFVVDKCLDRDLNIRLEHFQNLLDPNYMPDINNDSPGLSSSVFETSSDAYDAYDSGWDYSD